MAATILDGAAVAREIEGEIARAVAGLRREGVTPGLAVIRVGRNPASRIYVERKRKACERVGIHSEIHALPEETTQQSVADLIERLNASPQVHGILLQLPLPAHLRAEPLLERLAPAKDVDGLHPVSIGRLWLGMPGPRPCTPAGILELLRRAGVDPAGRRAVILGRSNIVGKPTAALLLQAHATVTLCHSRTRDLPALCREADILVAAVGRPAFVAVDWIRPGAAVLDVGVNRLSDGRVVGDVDPGAGEIAGHLSPVPGGVGPMTIAMLLANTVAAARQEWT